MRNLDLLINALKDKNWQIRNDAAVALGDLGDLKAVGPLIECLKDKDKQRVRRAAANSLGKIGDVSAVNPLISFFSTLGPVDDIDKQFRQTVAVALINIGSSGINELIGCIKNKDVKIRRAVTEALRRTKDARAGELLTIALKDKDPYIFQTATNALFDLGILSVDHVSPRINSNNKRIRLSAVKILGNICDEKAFEYLVMAAKDHDREVRKAADDCIVSLFFSRKLNMNMNIRILPKITKIIMYDLVTDIFHLLSEKLKPQKDKNAELKAYNKLEDKKPASVGKRIEKSQSVYWRCPHCRGILKKGGLDIMEDLRRAGGQFMGGTATCTGCQGTVSQKDVYDGKYDVPTYQIFCPNCNEDLIGAEEMLSGKSCPTCGNMLPMSGFRKIT